jgi:hypothetical protein
MGVTIISIVFSDADRYSRQRGTILRQVAMTALAANLIGAGNFRRTSRIPQS